MNSNSLENNKQNNENNVEQLRLALENIQKKRIKKNEDELKKIQQDKENLMSITNGDQIDTRNFSGYLEQLKKYQQEFSDLPIISNAITAALNADNSLKNRQLPHELPYLGFDDKARSELTQKMTKYTLAKQTNVQNELAKFIQDAETLDALLADFREYLIEKYGMWGYVSIEWVRDLSEYIGNTPTLEIMAGNGFLSAGLSAVNDQLQILATDTLDWEEQDNNNPEPITNVAPLEAVEAVMKYRDKIGVVILNWAPDTSNVDLQVLRALRDSSFFERGGKFIIVAEPNGATNSTVFWQQVELTDVPELNKHHQPFDFIRDHVYLAH